jgi:hypothetical protein
MIASKQLQRRWRAASDTQIASVLDDARRSVSAFADATAASGSLLQSWIGGREVVQFDHYPPDDVVDLRSGSQFYYHAHRDGDREHGHLHLFWHATSSGRRRHLRPGRTRWARTAPTHLFAISLDERGLPVGLFTVNRWVTDGHWFNAASTMTLVERFAMGDVEGYETSCRWLTGFVRLYRPLIEELLVKRDRRLARRADLERALDDKRLEVLSLESIDWAADLDALEAEANWRGVRGERVGAEQGRGTPLSVTSAAGEAPVPHR